jgi:FKBP-type peptidyl-prolyl cis-trans isomerase
MNKYFSKILFLLIFSLAVIACRNEVDLGRLFAPILAEPLPGEQGAALTNLPPAPASAPTSGLTPNGYAYERFGNGTPAAEGDWLAYQVEQLKNGALLYDSRQNAKPFKAQLKNNPNNPILEALALMGLGDSLRMTLKAAQLPRLPSGFAPNDKLEFRLRLLGVETEKEGEQDLHRLRARGETIDALMRKGLVENKPKMDVTKSGLRYALLRQGKKQALEGNVRVHYIGMLPDGKVFANTYQSGQPFVFERGKGQIIVAWEEAAALLGPGGMAVLRAPYALAYGPAGKPESGIPEETDLLFFLEIL